MQLAVAGRGSVTVVSVIKAGEPEQPVERRAERLRRVTQSVLGQGVTPPPVDYALRSGLPGIEIARCAEECGASLIVLGRKRRTERQRLLIGDTADAVARRSALPCLFVPAEPGPLTRVLAALDGTERGFAVLLAAVEFTRGIGGTLRAVTVEPAYENEAGVTRLPTERSARLARALVELQDDQDLGSTPRSPVTVEARAALVVRRGTVVEEITREIDQGGTDVLVVGYHRGGPASVIDGSVSRRLTHEVPTAVLTIPL